ncbi:serine/threonine-protein kinase [Hyalangium versicolor]|uniref:serine/threonine-protein kinase n=1 Tax=Hyalangium versicolor TaxID=2861190 RepID=UPI001CCB1F71|nr:serine/threonine-protein kinase [Hyalangium versicolor]
MEALIGSAHSLPTLPVGCGSESREVEQGLFAGRYLLRRVLGRGGMGTVYLAQDEVQGERVALKVLDASFARNPVALERFSREARLAQRISHRHVARVFELGSSEGRAFLTLEYVDGEDLRARLQREGSLKAMVAARVALAVCAGLGAAHEASVVHRDLKPANVMLERGGRVVLTDFGIARAMEDEGPGGLTLQDGVVGTPQYMAPEQLTESPVDARTDVYAVGLLLFEMLTGEPAFQATTLKGAYERLRRPPPDPRECTKVPAALAALVLRCLARAPEERPAGAAEVSRSLEAWLAQ